MHKLARETAWVDADVRDSNANPCQCSVHCLLLKYSQLIAERNVAKLFVYQTNRRRFRANANALTFCSIHILILRNGHNHPQLNFTHCWAQAFLFLCLSSHLVTSTTIETLSSSPTRTPLGQCLSPPLPCQLSYPPLFEFYV